MRAAKSLTQPRLPDQTQRKTVFSTPLLKGKSKENKEQRNKENKETTKTKKQKNKEKKKQKNIQFFLVVSLLHPSMCPSRLMSSQKRLDHLSDDGGGPFFQRTARPWLWAYGFAFVLFSEKKTMFFHVLYVFFLCFLVSWFLCFFVSLLVCLFVCLFACLFACL